MSRTHAAPVAAALASYLVMTASAAHAGELAQRVARLPQLQAPLGGSAFWIAPAMRLNGVPMTIKSFSSSLDPNQVLQHYERMLGDAQRRMRRSHHGPWLELAVLDDSYFATVRVRNTPRGAQGTITVTPPPNRVRPSTRTCFPHPVSARVVSLQQYEDMGVEAEHIHFVSRRSVALEARSFASMLSREGWQVRRSVGTGTRGYLIQAQRAAELAQIHLHRSQEGGATSIFVVWRKP